MHSRFISTSAVIRIWQLVLARCSGLNFCQTLIIRILPKALQISGEDGTFH